MLKQYQIISLLALLLSFNVAGLSQQSNSPVNYYYDALGRLTRVVDVNGSVASYNYDAVGNISSIARSTLSGLNVLGLSPAQGPVGQIVTIQGLGFSATPESNTVRFNGTQATVSAATNTSLTVLVPASATTGPISVTVGTQTATSSTNFTVIPASLVSVQVSPAAATLIVGGSSFQLKAVGTYTNGTQQDVTSLATWNSSNNSVGTVTSGGLASPVNTGVASITANFGGFTGFVNVKTVSQATPSSLTVSPSSLTTPKAYQQMFSAIGVFPDGSSGNVTSIVTWASSNLSVATISNAPGTQGVTTDTGVGSTTITASVAAATNSALLTLTAPLPVSMSVSPGSVSLNLGKTQQLAATETLTDGTTKDVTQISTWSSSQSTVATVSNSTGSQGLVTAVGTGTTTITAASGSLMANATVAVSNASAPVFPRFLYGINQDGTISSYGINATTGQLRSNAYIEDGGFFGSSIVVDPTNQYLYAATELGLQGYTVNTTNGSLAPIAGSPFTSSSFTNLAIHPSGEFLYAAGFQTVSAYAIGSNGALTPLAGSPYSTGGPAEAVVIDPAGKFLYALVTNGGTTSGAVYAYTINPNTGALTTTTGSPFTAGTNPDGLAVDPTGKFLYVANSGYNAGSKNLIPPTPGNQNVYARLWLDPFPIHDFLTKPIAEVDFAPHGVGEHSGVEEANRGVPVLLASTNALERLPFVSAGQPRAFRARAAVPQSGSYSGPSVSEFDIDSTTGALTEISGSPLPLNNSPTGVIVEKSGKYAYVPSRSSVSGFAIDPSGGALNQLPDSPYTGSVSTLIIDPSGQFAYGAGTGIFAWSINPSTGTLTSIGVFPDRYYAPAAFAIAAGPNALTYVPQFAFVASSGPTSGNPTGANTISGYSIDPSAGKLMPLPSSPFAEGLFPVSAFFDFSSSYLYVANNCSDPSCAAAAGSVSGYSVNPVAGTLTGVSGSPFLAGTNPSGVVVDPSGQFAYVLNQGGNSISGYSINSASGVLTPLTESPFAVSGFTPAAIAMDPVGWGLIVVGCSGSPCTVGTIAAYGISASGALTTYAPYYVSSGVSPSSVVFDPTANFVFVADGSSNTVSLFSVSPLFSDGYLVSAVTGSSFPTGGTPVAIAMDPTGTFVYVANQSSGNISAYSFNAATETLSPVTGSPFASGTSPLSLTVDYSGKFLYVVNEGDNTVSSFLINSLSGALTAIAGSPFPTGTVPVNIVTSGKTQ